MKKIQLIKLLQPIVIAISCLSVAEASGNEEQYYDKSPCRNQETNSKRIYPKEAVELRCKDIAELTLDLAANVTITKKGIIADPKITFYTVGYNNSTLLNYLTATICTIEGNKLTIVNNTYQPYQSTNSKYTLLIREHEAELNDEIALPTLKIEVPHSLSLKLNLFAKAGKWNISEIDQPIRAELQTSPKCNPTTINVSKLTHKQGTSTVKASGLSTFKVKDAAVSSIAYGNNFDKLVSPNSNTKKTSKLLELKDLKITEIGLSHN